MVNGVGQPFLKQWRFVTSSPRVATSLNHLRCDHPPGFKHATIQGKDTKTTEEYPDILCRTLLESQFQFYYQQAPVLGCTPKTTLKHQVKDHIYEDFHLSPFMAEELFGGSLPKDQEEAAKKLAATINPAMDPEMENSGYGDGSEAKPIMVHKLLSRKEMLSDPKALDALRTERDSLIKEDTWLEYTVQEFDDLIEWSKRTGGKIHHGSLMDICSIKHAESAHLAKYKGRIVFRGDNAKDQDGAAAVFQELSASPAGIHSANSNSIWLYPRT